MGQSLTGTLPVALSKLTALEGMCVTARGGAQQPRVTPAPPPPTCRSQSMRCTQGLAWYIGRWWVHRHPTHGVRHTDEAPGPVRFGGRAVVASILPHAIPSCAPPRRNVLCRSRLFEASSFRGPLPTELGAIQPLRSLWSIHSQLNSSLPTELGELTALVSVDLWNNSISGTVAAEALVRLTSLTRLCVGSGGARFPHRHVLTCARTRGGVEQPHGLQQPHWAHPLGGGSHEQP